MKNVKLTVDATVLTTMPNPYVAKTVELARGRTVVVASEGHGPVVAIDPQTWNVTEVAAEPGGCLDVAGVPGTDAIFLIGKCYAGYDFHNAGVYAVDVAPGMTPTRLFDLPFVHRLHSYRDTDGVHVLAATVAQTKDDADDWTRPGAVFLADFGDGGGAGERDRRATPGGEAAADGGAWLTASEPAAPVPLRPVLAEVHRNHGLVVRDGATGGAGSRGDTDAGNAGTLYISGAEGLFRAAIPAGRAGVWLFDRISATEISELGFVDLDGDGVEELVTIEPFHGDRLVAYRFAGRDALEALWTHRIAFGHGLWVGPIAGVPSVIVGNRRGHGNLELLRMGDENQPEVITLAEDTGTAQVAVVHDGPLDYVVATNQNSGEVVRYTVRGN